MTAASLRDRLLSRGPLDLLVQLLLLAGAYTAWRWARGAVAPDDLGAAFANGARPGLARAVHAHVRRDRRAELGRRQRAGPARSRAGATRTSTSRAAASPSSSPTSPSAAASGSSATRSSRRWRSRCSATGSTRPLRRASSRSSASTAARRSPATTPSYLIRGTRSSTPWRPCPRCTSGLAIDLRGHARPARQAALAEGAAVRLPPLHDLHRRRHRQPLLDRRPVRRDGRRRRGRHRDRPRQAQSRLGVQGRPRHRRGRAGRRRSGPRSRRPRHDPRRATRTTAPSPPRPRSCP